MNTVVFICLLSLSMCLGDTNPQSDAKPQLQGSNVPIEPATQAKPTGQASMTTEQISTVPAPNSNPQVNASAPNQTAPNTKANSNETKTNSTTPEKISSTEKVPEDNKEKKTEQPKDKNDTKAEGNTENKAAAVNGTTVDDKDKKTNDTATITTEKSVINKTTEAPKAVTETPPVQARAFDGPSFVGGIILTLGILAICVMGYRYHKNQTERNYHTL